MTEEGMQLAHVSMIPEWVNMDLPQPNIPAAISFSVQEQKRIVDPIRTTVKDVDRPRHLRAIGFVKYLATRIHGHWFKDIQDLARL